MSFVQAVRSRKIAQPVQLKFSLTEWETGFSKHSDNSTEDNSLFLAGKVLASGLETARNLVGEWPLDQLPLENATRTLIGLVNRDFFIVQEKSRGLTEHTTGKLLGIGSMAERKIETSIPGHSSNPVWLIETMISAVRFPLSQLMKSQGTGQKRSASEIAETILRHHVVAGLYEQLSEFWRDCLWGDRQIIELDRSYLIKPLNPELDIERAVGWFRWGSLQAEIALHMSQLWSELVAKHGTEMVVLRVRSLTRKKGRTNAVLGSTIPDTPPTRYLAQIAAKEIYWNELLEEKLPMFGNVTARELMATWNVISALAEYYSEVLEPIASKSRNPSQLCPSITQDDLVTVVIKQMGVSRSKAQSLVSCFIHRSVRDDPWIRPLVPMDSAQSNLALILAPYLMPNLIRSVEHWLHEGGIQEDRKGVLFEQHVRLRMAEKLKNSAGLRHTHVLQESFELSVDGTSEEIDLVWVMNTKIAIAELKCQKFPTNSMEEHNYVETIRGASAQISRKREFLEQHRNEANAALAHHHDVAYDAEIIPIVLINTPLFAGSVVDGIPVLDLMLVDAYLHGKASLFVIVSKEESKSHLEPRFYGTPEAAEEGFSQYSRGPATTELYRAMVDNEVIRQPTISEEMPQLSAARSYVNTLYVDRAMAMLQESNSPPESAT